MSTRARAKCKNMSSNERKSFDFCSSLIWLLIFGTCMLLKGKHLVINNYNIYYSNDDDDKNSTQYMYNRPIVGCLLANRDLPKLSGGSSTFQRGVDVGKYFVYYFILVPEFL